MAPVCTIIGGANGSGKSALFELLKPSGEFVNADNVARKINPGSPEAASLASGRAVLALLRSLVAEKRDFAYETTLSSHQALDLMQVARRAGYQVGLVFVALADVGLHITRVEDRVAQGGHDIPELVIRRRYEKSWQGLAAAIPLADGCLIYDNSGSEPVLLARLERTSLVEDRLDGTAPLHRRIAAVLAEALDGEG